MSRPRVHANPAERQRAYRQRLHSSTESSPGSPLPKARRPLSRPQRLAILQAETQRLHEEYKHWLEVLPESLQDTELATRLTDTVDQLAGVADLLSDINLPRGFGRD